MLTRNTEDLVYGRCPGEFESVFCWICHAVMVEYKKNIKNEKHFNHLLNLYIE